MRLVLLALLLSGCAYLKKPQPDDVCLVPCENAIGQVDVYRLDGNLCTCYRAADDSTHDPGATAQVPVK